MGTTGQADSSWFATSVSIDPEHVSSIGSAQMPLINLRSEGLRPAQLNNVESP